MIPRIDCLVISYSEPNRNRERFQFFNEAAREGSGWGRFLHLNYVSYDNDIFLPNQLASISKLKHESGVLEKDGSGYFKESDISFYSAWKIPLLGGLYLYQYLKNLAFNVEIIQHVQMQRKEFERLLSAGPRVIAISTTLILNPLDIAELVQYCRRLSPESVIVLGGVSVWNSYISNKNPDLFKIYKADAIVLEPKGVKTLASVVDCIKNGRSLNDVPNLLLFSNNKLVNLTPRYPENFDFKNDAIKWELIDNRLLDRISLLRTQISCPFSCSFCNYPTTQGPLLQASLDDISVELEALNKRGVKYLLFADDTFNVPAERFKQIMVILKRYNFSWYSFIRCQYLDKEQAVQMKESGCRGVYLGIESGNDAILKGMNKKATVDNFKRGVGLLAAQDITTYASFIIGFPGETEESIKDTQDFIATSGIDFYNAKIFYYDHSAPINADREKFGLSGQGMNWSHRTMNSSQAFTYAEKLIKDINTVPYIPQHSGEIWEIAHFEERGFTRKSVHRLYENFTKILREELSDSPDKEAVKKKLFEELNIV